MVGTRTSGPDAFRHQAEAALIRAAVFTGSYLAWTAGVETGTGDLSNCFWIEVGPVEDFT